MDWKLTTLGKVCARKLQTGPFGSQLHAMNIKRQAACIDADDDIINCRVDISNAEKISTQRAEFRKHRLLAGDLLFSRLGDVDVLP